MAIGIRTPLDLRAADPSFVRQNKSVVMERMIHELRGLPCIGLEEVAPARKSLVASRSFGRPVTTRHELEQAVTVYASRAAEKMRRQGLASANLTVFADTNSASDPQYAAQRSVRLPVATADSGKLIRAAMAALGQLWRPGYRYKKRASRCSTWCPQQWSSAAYSTCPMMRDRRRA